MTEGDVVLTLVPQADGTMKNRPAIFLREMPPFKDLLVCGISTQLRQEVKGFDELILMSDADFASSGLKRESVIRLGFWRLCRIIALSAKSVQFHRKDTSVCSKD